MIYFQGYPDRCANSNGRLRGQNQVVLTQIFVDAVTESLGRGLVLGPKELAERLSGVAVAVSGVLPTVESNGGTTSLMSATTRSTMIGVPDSSINSSSRAPNEPPRSERSDSTT